MVKALNCNVPVPIHLIVTVYSCIGFRLLCVKNNFNYPDKYSSSSGMSGINKACTCILPILFSFSLWGATIRNLSSSHSDACFWIKADATDVKGALLESARGEQNGDGDLKSLCWQTFSTTGGICGSER